MGWSYLTQGRIESTLIVSIPERVWGGLELLDIRGPLGCGIGLFQSLRGFGVGWSAGLAYVVGSRIRFNP